MIATTPSGTRTRRDAQPVGSHPAVEHLADRVGQPGHLAQAGRHGVDAGPAVRRRRSTTVAAVPAASAPADVDGVGGEHVGGAGLAAGRRRRSSASSLVAVGRGGERAGRGLGPAGQLGDRRARSLGDGYADQASSPGWQSDPVAGAVRADRPGFVDERSRGSSTALTPVMRPSPTVARRATRRVRDDVAIEAFNLPRVASSTPTAPHRRRALGADPSRSAPLDGRLAAARRPPTCARRASSPVGEPCLGWRRRTHVRDPASTPTAATAPPTPAPTTTGPSTSPTWWRRSTSTPAAGRAAGHRRRCGRLLAELDAPGPPTPPATDRPPGPESATGRRRCRAADATAAVPAAPAARGAARRARRARRAGGGEGRRCSLVADLLRVAAAPARA